MSIKKSHFILYGCKVNQYETNGMREKFIEKGYEIVDFNDVADIYIVNTCAVTNIADKKSRQILRRAKIHNKNAIVVAMGCYAQVAQKEIEKIQEVDLIIGNVGKKDIVEYVERFINKKQKNNIKDIEDEKKFADFGIVSHSEKTRMEIKIQDGCNQFCSYCIIPYARGRIRSRSKESILQEVQKNQEKGIREIVITGIHIASYGKDLGNITLIDLLEEIDKKTNINRIRLGSLEPSIIDEEFVNRLKKLNKICNQFHLSLQSGCDDVLKRMNRKYNTKEFEKCVDLLRNNIKDVLLTTDVIVGFPGESEEEFEKTYEYLEKIKFYKMHVFKYSKKSGTVAAKMPNQITDEIKEIRSKRLIELSDENEKKYLKSYIGKDVEVLFEEREGNFYKGHTTNYMLVKKESNKDLNNQIITVTPKELKGLELIC